MIPHWKIVTNVSNLFHFSIYFNFFFFKLFFIVSGKSKSSENAYTVRKYPFNNPPTKTTPPVSSSKLALNSFRRQARAL